MMRSAYPRRIAAILALLSICLLMSGTSAGAPGPLLAVVKTDLTASRKFFLASVSLNGDQTNITSLDALGGMVAMQSTWMPDKKAMAITSLGTYALTAFSVVSPSGKILGHWEYNFGVFTTIEYDTKTKQLFATAFFNADRQHHLLELDPATGNYTDLMVIPGRVAVSKSTYCPNDQVYYVVTLTDNPAKDALMRIDTQNLKVKSVVELEDIIQAMRFDYTAHVLYAWIAETRHPGVLTTVDHRTGKRLKTIVEFDEFSTNPYLGAGHAFDFTNKVFYGTWVRLAAGGYEPFWMSVDAKTGKYTKRPLHSFTIDLEFITQDAPAIDV